MLEPSILTMNSYNKCRCYFVYVCDYVFYTTFYTHFGIKRVINLHLRSLYYIQNAPTHGNVIYSLTTVVANQIIYIYIYIYIYIPVIFCIIQMSIIFIIEIFYLCVYFLTLLELTRELYPVFYNLVYAKFHFPY